MSSPLNPILEQLASDRASLRVAVSRVPADLREKRAQDGAWSVAEVLEHLAIIEEKIVMLITHFASTAPAHDVSSPPPDTTDSKRRALLNRSVRIEAPERVRPTGGVDAAKALEKLEGHRVALLAAIESARGKDLTAVSRTHPVLGEINGYQWLLAQAGHEARHAAQIEEIATRLHA